MFEAPDAKRVKRSHLFQDESSQGSRASTKSSSPEVTQDNSEHGGENPSYGFEYDFITPTSGETNTVLTSGEPRPLEEATEPDDPEYQFRLFAPVSASAIQKSQLETGAKVRLSATPEPVALAEALSLENAHFVRPNRPHSYYFTSENEDKNIQQLQSEYADAALSTSDVLARAESTKWPGTALPWRLIQVELLNKAPKLKRQGDAARSSGSARTRPSKKRRILFRRRLALRNELAAQTKAAEETEREKRTRRNREKKVKKKEKEKRKKADGVDRGAADGNDADGIPDAGEGEDGGNARVVETSVLTSSTQQAGAPSISRHVEVDAERSNDRAGGAPASNGHSSKAEGSVDAATAVETAVQPIVAAPTRRTPTSQAPTAAPTAIQGYTSAKAPISAHPTRRRL